MWLQLKNKWTFFLLFQLDMKDGDSDKSGVEYKETKNNKIFDNNES